MFLDCPAYLNEEDPGHPSYHGIERTSRTVPGKAIRSTHSVRRLLLRRWAAASRTS